MVPRSDTWDGIPVRYPRYPRPPGAFYRKFEPFAMLPASYSCFRTWFRERPFDLIHAHGLLPCGMAAILLSRAFRLPCLCHARGSDVNVYPSESRANFLLTRYVIENCDAPAATSKALAEKMSSMSRVPRKISVLYKSVDTKLFTPAADKGPLRRGLGIPPRAFVAIFVGNLSHDKGVTDLSAAWANITKKLPMSILVLIGDVPLSGNLAALGSGALICGPKPHREVALWMQASDVLVLPSYGEGLPNVVLEAMACGLPVVATSVGGIPEAIVQGKTGLLIPAGDRSELTSSILALAQNESLRRSMGKAGRRRIQTLFRWDAYVSHAWELYRSVLENRAAQSFNRVARA